jgi:DNA (cytosine-5)-methyltransferase 1
MSKKKDKQPTIIDLFSGCGGLSLGFEMAGFKSILACDFWKPACLTFKNNFPGCQLFEKDIKDLNKTQLEGIENIDVVTGGPPCQGFSTAGKQWLEDPRNRLFVEFLRIINLVRPKYVVMENVPPILTLASGRFLKEIIASFKKISYQVKANVINARYYGVPQERKRAIFLAWQIGLKEPQFPKPKPLPYVTCREAISDLENEEFSEKQKYHAQAQSEYQTWSRGDSRELFNHVGSTISLLNQRRAAEITQGANEAELPNWLKLKSRRTNPKLKNISTGFRRLEANKASPTIIRASGLQSQPLHYRFNRQLTVRELAKLCSFPDSFVFYGNIRDQKGQIGNAVPPLLASAIAKEIKKVL